MKTLVFRPFLLLEDQGIISRLVDGNKSSIFFTSQVSRCILFLPNSVVVEKQIVKILTISHCLCLPLKVADHVVMMDCYSCHDVTDKAKVKE